MHISKEKMHFLVSCLLIWRQITFQIMETNKKSVSCEIRNRLGKECSVNTYNSNITEQKLKKCTDDITSLLKSLCIYSKNVEKCSNATEQWLIQNWLKQSP